MDDDTLGTCNSEAETEILNRKSGNSRFHCWYLIVYLKRFKLKLILRLEVCSLTVFFFLITASYTPEFYIVLVKYSEYLD